MVADITKHLQQANVVWRYCFQLMLYDVVHFVDIEVEHIPLLNFDPYLSVVHKFLVDWQQYHLIPLYKNLYPPLGTYHL